MIMPVTGILRAYKYGNIVGILICLSIYSNEEFIILYPRNYIGHS